MAESLGELNALQNEGKIRHIGVSNFDAEQLAQAREMIDRRLGPEPLQRRVTGSHEAVLEVCERDGLGFIPWFPLGRRRSEATNARRSRSRGCCASRR